MVARVFHAVEEFLTSRWETDKRTFWSDPDIRYKITFFFILRGLIFEIRDQDKNECEVAWKNACMFELSKWIFLASIND